MMYPMCLGEWEGSEWCPYSANKLHRCWEDEDHTGSHKCGPFCNETHG